MALRHSSSWILRIFFTLLILSIILFAYLHLVGLPAPFTDSFIDRMAARGYFLQIERLTLEIDRGLVARNVRLFATAETAEPFMEAEAFTVALDPVALLRHRQAKPIITITGGSFRAQLGPGRITAPEGSRSVAVDRIQLRFSAAGQEVLLREFSADFLNIHFRGRGAVYLAPPVAGAGPRLAPDNPLVAAFHAIENAPKWVLQLIEQGHEIVFNESPTADFSFALFLAHSQANRVDFRLNNPTGGSMRGVSFDQFTADVAWKDQQIHLSGMQIHKGLGQLGASGWYNLTNQVVYVHLLNNLPPGTFLDLFPEHVRTKAKTVISDYRFPMRLDLEIGPCPAAAALEHFTGRLFVSRALVRDVPIENLEMTVTRDGPELRIDKAAIQLDQGPLASRLEIHDGSYDLASRQFQARIAGTLNPHVLKPLLTPSMRDIVEWFDVREPVAADVVLGGVAGNPAIYCYGPVLATNFAINRVEVQSLQANLNISNEVMHITEATLVRPEGMARGDVHMAFSNQTLRLEGVDSTLDVRAISEMLGPEVADFMKPFRLNRPARLQVHGILDICNFSLNQLQAHVEAQRLGYGSFETDHANFDLTVRGRRLRFTNAVATAYGGQFTNISARLYPVANDANWRYEVDFAATNLNLTNLLFALTGERPEKLSGTLDGNARIGGYIGQGSGTNATGSGQAAIRNGLLLETRLFRELSNILSLFLPKEKVFAQTDARGDFTLQNGRFRSRNIELQGTIFSVKADGHYAFDGAFDFDVEVQLLRGGPVAALVRLATLPVTRLLEFRLTGTFEEPRWRPVNLNLKELFQDKDPPASGP